MAAKDMVIYDDYIYDMAEHIENSGNKLQEMIDEYLAILQDLMTDGIVSADIIGKIQTCQEDAKSLEQVIMSTAEEIKNLMMVFLEEIDQKDQDLY